MAATLGFRAQSLGIPVKGLVLRQPVFIFNTYQKAAKKEWLPLLKSREENADSPILGANHVVSSHQEMQFGCLQWIFEY
jgi:acetyl esterase/lipase